MISYALVVKTSKDNWHMQDPNLANVKDVYECNKEYYRVEKWHWKEGENGNTIYKKEQVDVN